MKTFDIPPVWLLLTVLLALALPQVVPAGLSLKSPVIDLLSAVFLGGGVILIAMAVSQMRRMQTTFHPREEAARLVTGGVFKWSRNPIYLGYVLILAGVILCFDTILSLPLVPIFLWFIEKRFVIPEENALRKKFRLDFARYSQKTRRWV